MPNASTTRNTTFIQRREWSSSLYAFIIQKMDESANTMNAYFEREMLVAIRIAPTIPKKAPSLSNYNPYPNG
jgi:hypothetical protein